MQKHTFDLNVLKLVPVDEADDAYLEIPYNILHNSFFDLGLAHENGGIIFIGIKVRAFFI